MKVRIVSYSQPDPNSREFGGKNLEQLVAYCARVSNPSNQHNDQTAERLLEYLIAEKHFSPFEMVNICLEIETTRDIARQMLRHRSFSFQEFSQRYADPTEELEFVTKRARSQDSKNRQNSIDDIPNDIQDAWRAKQLQIIHEAKLSYSWAIENGIAKECARVVLPEGMTVSRLYMNGTLRSWIHYLELRSGNGTQQEHIEVAKACAEVISRISTNAGY